MAQLLIPLKDEACKGPGGEYYNLAYWRADVGQLKSLQIHVGKNLVDTEDLISQADETLRAQFGERHRRSNVYVAASTLIRLCVQHPQPVLELSQNTIVVPPGNVPFSLQGYEYNLNVSETAENIKERYAYPPSDPYRRRFRITYLPREDYAGSANEHTAITSDRGGDTGQVHFGLLGGEILLPFPPASEPRA